MQRMVFVSGSATAAVSHEVSHLVERAGLRADRGLAKSIWPEVSRSLLGRWRPEP